jgi:D-glycero-D-manno-heptose 1,7-bisphosphate phosphatase
VKRDETNRRRAAFLDRDGVINIDRGYVHRREDFDFVPGVLEGARRLHDLDYALVVVSNQSGIGRGLFGEVQFHALSNWMREKFIAAGAPLSGVYFCPHHPTEARGLYLRSCDCRKPAPGMLLSAASDLHLDLGASAMFGDNLSDLEAALAAGVPLRVLLGTDGRDPPSADGGGGVATASFRRLDEALEDHSLFTATDARSRRA